MIRHEENDVGKPFPAIPEKVMDSRICFGVSPAVRWFWPRGLQLIVMKKVESVATQSGGMWESPRGWRDGSSSEDMVGSYQERCGTQVDDGEMGGIISGRDRLSERSGAWVADEW